MLTHGEWVLYTWMAQIDANKLHGEVLGGGGCTGALSCPYVILQAVHLYSEVLFTQAQEGPRSRGRAQSLHAQHGGHLLLSRAAAALHCTLHTLICNRCGSYVNAPSVCMPRRCCQQPQFALHHMQHTSVCERYDTAL